MSFNEFVNVQNSEVSLQREVKRNIEIARFQELVSQLYSLIENDWLRDYLDGGRVIITKSEILITEEKLGEYSVNELHIRIGSDEVVLRPKGTNIVGTDARIDVVYLNIPRLQIIRARQKIENPSQLINFSVNGEKKSKKLNLGDTVWKVMKMDTRRTLIELTKQTFEETIMSVLNNG